MVNRYLRLARVTLLVACAGCSKSTLETAKNDPPAPMLTIDRELPKPSPVRIDSAALSRMKPWRPHFIPTGSACGIMVEFTGLKKNKQLNARFCTLELQRWGADTSVADSLSSPLTGSKIVSLTSPINDLRQAFFKVSPGIYLVRQTREWADRSYFRNVEVQDGSYSIMFIDVFQAWSARAKPVTQNRDD